MDGNGWYNNVGSFTVTVSGASDLAPTSLTWNTAQGGVDFGYRVSGADLTQDTTAALYWAHGTSFADVIGSPVYDTTIERQADDYGPFYVPNSVLGTPPPGATHLLLVTDPANRIAESDETNNVRALAIQQLTIEVLVPERPLMGQAYELQVRVTNNASVPITVTIDWREVYIDNPGFGVPALMDEDPPEEVLELKPGETQTLTLATISHRWQWIPTTPPPLSTLPPQTVEQIVETAASGTADLLAALLDLPGLIDAVLGDINTIGAAVSGAIYQSLGIVIAQLDILNELQDVRATARIDYRLRATYGPGYTNAEVAHIKLEVSPEQQRHFSAYVLFRILAKRFQTGIPPLDFFLSGVFTQLAVTEYRRALRTP